jgi:carbon storage regulator
MLVVTRRTGQEIMIGDNIRIIVTAVRADRLRLGITAPQNVRVDRAEVHKRRVLPCASLPPRSNC